MPDIINYSSIICFGFGISLLILFGVSIFVNINYNLLFVGMFLAINGIYSDKNKYYNSIDAINKRMDKNYEIKIFKVSSLNKADLVKRLSPAYYSVFVYSDGKKNKIINEQDLFDL